MSTNTGNRFEAMASTARRVTREARATLATMHAQRDGSHHARAHNDYCCVLIGKWLRVGAARAIANMDVLTATLESDTSHADTMMSAIWVEVGVVEALDAKHREVMA